MSRKRRPQHKSFPWPIVMFGGIVLIAAALVLGLRNGNGGAKATSGTGPAAIAAEPAKIDYGYLKLGTNESFKIKVTNTGGGVLRFTDQPYIEVLEGC